jgi:hypothetical protein
VPSILLGFICYWLAFQVTPPLLKAAERFVDATVTQQESLVKSMEGMQASMIEMQKTQAVIMVNQQSFVKTHAEQTAILAGLKRAEEDGNGG